MTTNNSSVAAITLDVDWAPDWAIEQAARILIDNRTRATWFLTHQSPALDLLLRHSDLFEFGIHPNLLPGSTHGTTEDEVLAFMRRLVPSAVSMRTHGLYQTSNFLAKAAAEFDIRVDASLFLPRAKYLAPHVFRCGGASIWRVPYSWEDDAEMNEPSPIWTLREAGIAEPGLRIFDFHPIHLAINAPTPKTYEEMKRLQPGVGRWTPEFVDRHANCGTGPKTLYVELAEHLRGGGAWIRDLARGILLP